MWPKLIELVMKWWQAKPRKDIIAGIVELRDAMVACQRHYEIFKKEADVSDALKAHQEWLRSLGRIARVIEEFDRILVIFGPEAREATRQYLEDDSREAKPKAVFEGTAIMLETEDMGVDFRRERLTESFNSALGELDGFIRSTFKPEEIHAARTQRWGPSYHLVGL